MKLISLLMLMAMSLQEQPIIDVEVNFLGWSKDSNEFGYLVEQAFRNHDNPKKTSIYYVKEIATKGKLRDIEVKSGDVLKHIKKRSYVKYGLNREQVSDLIYKFDLGKNRYLKFEVVVKKNLKYRLSSFSGVKSTVIKEGTFDDIYTRVEPSIYLSPSGTYAVCVIKAKTPYNRKDALFFFRNR